MGSLERLLQNAPVLMEGAMGSLLMGAGLAPGSLGERLNLEQPEVVAGIHRRYAAAGARVHFSNTFNGNSVRMSAGGLADSCRAANRAGAELARAAAGSDGLVAGSMGPTGELLAPLGTLAPDVAERVFAEQADALAEGGVDVLWIETMMSLEEAGAAIAGCRRSGDLPVAVSFSFTDTPRGFFTMMGHSVIDCVKRCESAGVAIFGANCQLGSQQMVRLARKLKAATHLPVAIQPNAGTPELRDGRTIYSETAEQFAQAAVELAALGVELIGGCCGTTPEFIAAAGERLAGRPVNPRSCG